MKMPAYDNAVERAMYEHWMKCDNSPVGDDARFKHILSEVHHAINAGTTQKIFLSSFYKVFSKIAAILLIPLMIAFFVVLYQQYTTNPEMYSTISVPPGARSQITLPDGSEVMLNAGSELTYPMSFKRMSTRKVKLVGEGFFKVKKDDKIPFIVKMNDVDVKVTGTSFNARAYFNESSLTVVLVEGAVQLGRQTDEDLFNLKQALKPNDVFVLDKKSKKAKLLHNKDLTKYIAWTQGRTVFDNDPLQIVIDKLEKLYNIEVLVQDDELFDYRLTATFTNEPLETALRIFSLSSPVSYQLISDSNEKEGVFNKRTLLLRKKHK